MGLEKAVKVKRENDYDERLERRLKRRCIAKQKIKGNPSTPNKNHHVIFIDVPELDDVEIQNCSLDDGDGDGDAYHTANFNAMPHKKNIVDATDISRLDGNLHRNLNCCQDGRSHDGNVSAKPTPKKENVVDGVDNSKLDDDLHMFLNGDHGGNRHHTPKGKPSTKAVPNRKNVPESINVSEPDDNRQTFLNGHYGFDRSATFLGLETDEVDKDYLDFLTVYNNRNVDSRTVDPEAHAHPDDDVVGGTAYPEIHIYPDNNAVARTVDHDICVPKDDVLARDADSDIHDAGGHIGDFEDPQYKLFLQKLRVDKKSYVLEFEMDDGITLLLKYECEEFNLPGRENLKTSTVKDKLDVSRDPSGGLRRKNKSLKSVKEKTPTKRSEMNDKSAPEMCIQSRESPENFEQVVDKRQQLLIERDAGAKDANFMSDGVKKCLNLGPRQENLYCTEDEEVTCDESYATFLHFIRKDGEILVLNHNGEQVRYAEDSDDDDEEESTSDVMIIDNLDLPDPGEDIPGNSLFSAINLDDDECGEDPRRCHQSYFREDLLDILKMPYDAREYADLYGKITFKRPKTYVRRLRNGMEKAYPAEGVGKSYLDQYTDLAEKLGLVKENQHKTLNLLRGFFYWLNNLPREGVFRPWLDPACLSVLPGT